MARVKKFSADGTLTEGLFFVDEQDRVHQVINGREVYIGIKGLPRCTHCMGTRYLVHIPGESFYMRPESNPCSRCQEDSRRATMNSTAYHLGLGFGE